MAEYGVYMNLNQLRKLERLLSSEQHIDLTDDGADLRFKVIKALDAAEVDARYLYPPSAEPVCGYEWKLLNKLPYRCKLPRGHAGIHKDGSGYAPPTVSNEGPPENASPEK